MRVFMGSGFKADMVYVWCNRLYAQCNRIGRLLNYLELVFPVLCERP